MHSGPMGHGPGDRANVHWRHTCGRSGSGSVPDAQPIKTATKKVRTVDVTTAPQPQPHAAHICTGCTCHGKVRCCHPQTCPRVVPRPSGVPQHHLSTHSWVRGMAGQDPAPGLGPTLWGHGAPSHGDGCIICPYSDPTARCPEVAGEGAAQAAIAIGWPTSTVPPCLASHG